MLGQGIPHSTIIGVIVECFGTFNLYLSNLEITTLQTESRSVTLVMTTNHAPTHLPYID